MSDEPSSPSPRTTPPDPGTGLDWRRILMIGALVTAILAACGLGFLVLRSLQSSPPPATAEVRAATATVAAPYPGPEQTAEIRAVETEPAAEPTADVFPLAGQIYPGSVFTGTEVTAAMAEDVAQYYAAEWTSDGRLWQPLLRELSNEKKVAFSVAIQLPAGSYEFNGVACKLWVDADRNGKGSANPITADHENGREFSVRPAAGDTVAWGLVSCDGGPSTGFDIWYLGP